MSDWPIWTLFFFFLFLTGAAFFLLFWKMARLENRFQEDRALQAVQAHLKQFAEALEGLDLRPIEGYLFEVKEHLSRIEKRLARSSIQEPAEQPPAPAGSLQEAVETRLQRLGFDQIRILTNLQSLNTDPCEVQVEASKEDVSYKGRIIIHGGVVVETRMQPSYEVFP